MNILIIVIIASILQDVEEYKLYKCINESTNLVYSLQNDHTVSTTDYSEQWNVKRYNIKRWSKQKDNIVFETNENQLITYRADSLQGLVLYINPIIDSTWNNLRKDLEIGLLQDETVRMFMTYKIDIETARQDLVMKAKYEYLKSRFCGMDVLIKLPDSLIQAQNRKKKK